MFIWEKKIEIHAYGDLQKVHRNFIYEKIVKGFQILFAPKGIYLFIPLL